MKIIRQILNAITPQPRTNQQILEYMKYLYKSNKLSINQQKLNHLKSLLPSKTK